MLKKNCLEKSSYIDFLHYLLYFFTNYNGLIKWAKLIHGGAVHITDFRPEESVQKNSLQDLSLQGTWNVRTSRPVANFENLKTEMKGCKVDFTNLSKFDE